jgi:DNA-binding transcriptional regulator YiaG
MVKAMVDIDPRTNQVLNIVKAKYSLKDKSEAIDKVVEIYEVEMLEPELKPAFVKKIKKIRKEKSIKVDSFADRYGLN